MKSFITKVLWAALVLSVSQNAYAKLNVFTCEPEWAALVKELAGKKAKVFSATHARQDPHFVQARPSLIAKLRSADLAVCTGAQLETGWMPMLQRRARNPKVLKGRDGHFESARHVRRLEIPGRLDRTEGDVHGDGNPHIQLDPRRILKVARALSKRLQKIDPGNEQIYKKRFQQFNKRWKASLVKWKKKAGSVKGKKVIVHHREWIYLLDWLRMKRVGSLEPKPGIPPTISHLSDLKQRTADLVIISPLNDKKPSKWLRKQTGIPVVVLPHTVGAVPNSKDLFAFFDKIVHQLVNKVSN